MEFQFQSVETVLKRLFNEVVRVRQDKCSFSSKDVVHLGQEIDVDELHSIKNKVQPITNVALLINVTEFKLYLSLLNYY